MLATTNFALTVRKQRLFDIDLRLHPKVTELADILIDVAVPFYDFYDVLTVPIRDVTTMTDPFTVGKEDASSFFSTYESQEASLINSTYASPDLKVMEPVSAALARPLGKFESIQAITANDISQNISDQYVALNFFGITSFDSFEIVRPGLSFVMTDTTKGSFIDAATDDHPISTLTECFDVELTRYNSVISGCVATGIQSAAQCSLYYGVLFIPLAKDYYFSVQFSTKGDIVIDEYTVFETDSTATQTFTLYLESGYHSFVMHQYSGDVAGTEAAVVKYKVEVGDAYQDFTVSNLEAQGLGIYTVPVAAADIVEDETFFTIPNIIQDLSLTSLLIKQYRPIIVLTRQKAPLLQKEFSIAYMLQEPTNITTSALIEGDVSNIQNSYTIASDVNGVVIEADRTIEPIPFITYSYAQAVSVTRFELTESIGYDTTSYDALPSTAFSFTLTDALGVVWNAADLLAAVRLEECRNIEFIQEATGTSLEITKMDPAARTVVVFNRIVDVVEFTIQNPITSTHEWGCITALRLYGELLELSKLIDRKGDTSFITGVDDPAIITVPYSQVGFIPSIFKPRYLPKDLQYGGEYLLFCLNVLGQIPPIEVLGNTFIISNNETHNLYDKDYLLNNKQMTLADDRLFTLTDQIQSGASYSFAYVAYNLTTEQLIQTDYSTIVVTVQNNTAAELVNTLVSVAVPNIGVGYTATDSGGAAPIAGLTSDDALTDDPILWNTGTVKITVASVPASGTETVTLTQGTFSDPGTVVGAAADYTAAADLFQLPVVVARVPEIVEGATANLYALNSAVPCVTNNSISYDLPSFLTIKQFTMTDLLGQDRTDIQLIIDVADTVLMYNRCPLCVFDEQWQPLDTVGVNLDGSTTNNYAAWNGTQISCIIPTVQGGTSAMFFVRVHSFTGDPVSFISSITTDLTSMYHFSGSLVNSVDGIYAVVEGATLTADKERGYNKAYSFVNSQYIQLPDTLAADFSISLWMRTEAADTGIFCTSTAAAPAQNTGLNAALYVENGYLTFNLQSGTLVPLVSTGAIINDAGWHHVVITMETGVGTKMYVDSALVASDVQTTTYATTRCYLGFAERAPDLDIESSWYDGALDEVRIYTRVLVPEEIELVHTVFDGTQTGTLVRITRDSLVHSPVNQITNLFDLSSLQGTPLVIYKYLGVDESTIRWIT